MTSQAFTHPTNEPPTAAELHPLAAEQVRSLWVLIWLLAIGIGVHGLWAGRVPAERLHQHAVTTVNPNTAPWWELAALPGVGPATARAIIYHREDRRKMAAGEGGAIIEPGDSPVFQSAHDLLAVRGIGPVTLRRIGPYLHFEEPAR